MKNAKKRVISVCLSIMLIIGLVSVSMTGCKKSSTTADSSASQQIPEGGIVPENQGGKTTDTFTILVGWKKNCPEQTTWQQVMSKSLNMNIKCEYIQSDDPVTAANLKLASGGFADMAVFASNETVKKAMINSNLIQPVEKYFKMSQLPNISSISQKIVKYITTSDNHVWYIPGWYAQEPDNPWPGWTATAWWPNTDILKKVGMTKDDLSTIEGVEKYLQAASNLKDSNGNAILPLGYATNDDGTIDNGIILTTFGLDTQNGVSGMPGIRKSGNDFVFMYDDPQYKAAYQWINKMYRQKLIDAEVTTDKKERYQEKVVSGSYAMIAGSIWNANLNNVWSSLDGPTAPGWYYEPVKDPKVDGVAQSGAVQYVNPYPGFTTFISKNTKHINAIMHFLDWCNEAKPERQQEVNEGPLGTTWNWTDASKPLSTWDFNADYKADRDSGDQAKVDKCTPQLYGLASYSSKWYPWFTEAQENNKKGATLIYQYCQEIGNGFGISRVMHVYDAVQSKSGGAIEKNLALLNNVVKEYSAKMTMAKSDADFEAAYNEFKTQLETRAHWSDMKKEWQSSYNELVKEDGEW
ncbi:MAG: extracellular solute-binding protein [Clostridiales bacterium]|nr:extracellular solute-binding protein [Clostridiales bacterium]